MYRRNYCYDTEALAFIEKRTDRRSLLKFWGVLAASAFALALTVYLSPAGSRLTRWWLDQESAHITQQIVRQQKQLAELESKLEQIHRHDQDFYSSLLEVPTMPASVWNGGVGGSSSPSPRHPAAKALGERLETLKRRLSLQRENHTQLIATAQAKSEALSRLPVLVPVRGHYISGFGYRVSPIHGHGHFHSGIDFAAPMGTPIYAANDGEIITAGWPESGYGLQVEIAHGNGFVTKYAHLSKLDVQIGQKVKRGAIIGRVGSTGQSIGPHLHYEVIRRGAKINPAPYLLLQN